MFLSLFSGFWFGSIGGDIPGNVIVNAFVNEFPNTPLVFGFPLVFIGIMLAVMTFLALVGARIGKWDFNLGYGRIIRRLNTMIKEAYQPYSAAWKKEMMRMSIANLETSFGIKKGSGNKSQFIDEIRAVMIIRKFNRNYPIGTKLPWLFCRPTV